jgi:hypothetical protein
MAAWEHGWNVVPTVVGRVREILIFADAMNGHQREIFLSDVPRAAIEDSLCPGLNSSCPLGAAFVSRCAEEKEERGTQPFRALRDRGG